MPVFRLDERFLFPPAEEADPDGLVAVGGDLDPARLVAAYRQGLFPWPHDGLPLLWFSPDPRLLLAPGEVHASRSLSARLRRGVHELRFDTAFAAVVCGCAEARRRGPPGTWITPDMARAYGALHAEGLAHSVEVWRAGRLVGGLYGVSLGAAFFGESMFSAEADASKLALVGLARRLAAWRFHFIDGQLPTPHLLSMGGRPCRRAEYLRRLALALEQPTRRGPWTDARSTGPRDPGDAAGGALGSAAAG